MWLWIKFLQLQRKFIYRLSMVYQKYKIITKFINKLKIALIMQLLPLLTIIQKIILSLVRFLFVLKQLHSKQFPKPNKWPSYFDLQNGTMLYTKFFGSKASNTNNHSDSILFSMQENQRLIKNDIRNFRSDQSFEVVNFELRYRSVKFFELIHDRSD